MYILMDVHIFDVVYAANERFFFSLCIKIKYMVIPKAVF